MIRHIDLDPFEGIGKLIDKGKQLTMDDEMVYGSCTWSRWHIARAMSRALGTVGLNLYIPGSMGPWCRTSAIPFLLLLAMAPKATSVKLRISDDWGLNGLPLFRRDEPHKPTLDFPNLMHLHLDFERIHIASSVVPTASLSALLTAAPNLTTLTLREFPPLTNLPDLPAALTSLILIDTHLPDAALQKLPTTSPSLRRLCAYSYTNSLGDPDDQEHLSANRITHLSLTPLASSLHTLALCSTVLSDAPVAALGRFSALKVLAIRYAFVGAAGAPDKNLYLLEDAVGSCCPGLRAVLVTGAFRASKAGVVRFGMAVKDGKFVGLRRVMLVCRGEFWDKLKRRVTAGVERMFEQGGVELVLKVHEFAGTAALVEELEEGLV